MSELVVTPMFQSAMDAVREGRNVFITGRAGTGKSTLLSMIRSLELGRSCTVVAPTGVAALNVEGETVHSFFGFRPSLAPELREYRPPARLDDVDMLIVDEVSMARADLIDMMDTALRRRRRSDVPFGGVQMVLVGDLYQLPPVVADHDQEPVTHRYATPFFFSAKALRDFCFETIELEEVFRQRDDQFVHLLNTIRDGTATQVELDELNTRVDPEAAGHPDPGTIVLTTTNRAANAANRAMLERLDGPVFTSPAVTSGEIDASQYKAEAHISFAVGAQVMMLVNAAEYVNGSLGRIVDVQPEKGSFRVCVELTESGEVVEVRPHRWEIVRPVRHDDQVTNEVVGSFTQLPFRLAWAVTVHKSQGKTFDQLVFDRGRRVFAAGQLYVALSRCTSLAGLTLKQPLRPRDVITDPEVKRFHAKAHTERIRHTETTRSFVGYLTTGGGEHRKLVEIAVVRETAAGDRLAFTTLVNPLRDVGDAAEAGIGAADVAVAPTILELRGLLGALLSGTVLVSQGLGELHRLLDWGQDEVAEGLGIDLRDRGLTVETGEQATALDRARAVANATAELGDQELPIVPLTESTPGIRGGRYLLPRDGQPDLMPLMAFIEGMPLSAEAQLDLMLGLAPGAQGALTRLVEHVRGFADRHQIPRAALATGAEQVVEALIAAASRNATYTVDEVRIIEVIAEAFDVPVDRSKLTSETDRIELHAGMRVCFTGSPPSGDDHAHLSKQSLRDAASAAGLEETPSVTKKKCDLLVAFDPASMSGKAKKARELGKPVVAAAEFLDQLVDLSKP